MKFAKELEEGLVPEWKAKYFDYKANVGYRQTGKKKLKAVARALRGVGETPRTLKARSGLFAETSLFDTQGPQASPFVTVPADSCVNKFKTFNQNSSQLKDTSSDEETSPDEPSQRDAGTENADRQVNPSRRRSSAWTAVGGRPSTEDHAGGGRDSQSKRDTAVTSSSFRSPEQSQAGPAPLPPTLFLPDPALDPGDGSSANRPSPQASEATAVPGLSYIGSPPNALKPSLSAGDLETACASTSTGAVSTPSAPGGLFRSRHGGMSPTHPTPMSGLRASIVGAVTRGPTAFTAAGRDAQLESYREFDLRQTQFFAWMDQELQKVESFYRYKEDEANDRLRVLQEQLREMRQRRMGEAMSAKRARDQARASGNVNGDVAAGKRSQQGAGKPNGPDNEHWLRSAGRWMPGLYRKNHSRSFSLGDDLPSGQITAKSPKIVPSKQQRKDDRRDFVRRKRSTPDAVSYRQAKRKLKIALAEYYRGLELLKSYTLLNRTAFRKMNKKYDKTVHAYFGGRYVAEKVNNAWFVQSAVLDSNMRVVEELYAKYFERGNHKIAVGKLKTKSGRADQYHGSVYRNGLLVGAGIVLGIQGIVAGGKMLDHDIPIVKLHTAYLLQMYAGYFLALFLFMMFCLACRLWTHAKINYIFIFEFHTRHHLDWRQLSELPCLFLFLEGLCVWLNFARAPPDKIFLYYPVILIGLTFLILFFPARAIYHRGRWWFLYSNWRLLWAGFYPVEFRDFFLGDMYCSLTYAMGNMELFFCLYAHSWEDPINCNSSHSRLLGFLTSLPGIWRALQCFRRYHDTRNLFPHLANGGKYLCTVLHYVSLSLYRIGLTSQLRALFISCATINSVYCSVWDVVMDWSLCNPYAEHPFLRDTLGYKYTWMYYVAMILDPLLRFNWIFYVFFARDIQHSALLSFFLSFSEVIRRSIWMLLRVENEHCTNVGRFRASRDIPLPYEIPNNNHSRHSSVPSNATGSPILARNGPGQTRPSGNGRRPSFLPLSPPGADDTFRTVPLGSPPGALGGADLERATTRESIRSAIGGGSRRWIRRPGSTSDPGLNHQPGSPLQRSFTRVGTMMAQAHAQDFERKRKSVVAPTGEHLDDRDGIGSDAITEPESSDEDDDDDDGEEDDEDDEQDSDEGDEEMHDARDNTATAESSSGDDRHRGFRKGDVAEY
ncbi:MAG: tRNA (adenine-N(1)-)-methyltransferase catalytic subunit trm61 [Watsoniomyces obsoletus]|nr:MAG: tRNA (adenine-N(1)-)-methyltransferase catalytic subunit trm61 [Watsoniomyces obsoletus]